MFICLEQNLMLSKLVLGLLCSRGYPSALDPLASASQVLGLQVCTIMPDWKG